VTEVDSVIVRWPSGVVQLVDPAPAVDGIITVVETPKLPSVFALLAAAPNPTTGNTTIGFALPRACNVRLDLFDITGRCVRTLADWAMPAGTNQVVWDGRDAKGRPVASGVYFYRLEAEGFTAARRLVLAR
jgi:hypothetical protein